MVDLWFVTGAVLKGTLCGIAAGETVGGFPEGVAKVPAISRLKLLCNVICLAPPYSVFHNMTY